VDGIILLAVAENKLCWDDLLKPKLESVLASPLPAWTLGYGPKSGQLPVRQTVASFLEKYITKVCIYGLLRHCLSSRVPACTEFLSN
jgi:hypothetical protein